MKVLVINAGSSSIKYQLIDMTDETLLAKGDFYTNLYNSQFEQIS